MAHKWKSAGRGSNSVRYREFDTQAEADAAGAAHAASDKRTTRTESRCQGRSRWTVRAFYLTQGGSETWQAI